MQAQLEEERMAEAMKRQEDLEVRTRLRAEAEAEELRKRHILEKEKAAQQEAVRRKMEVPISHPPAQK